MNNTRFLINVNYSFNSLHLLPFIAMDCLILAMKLASLQNAQRQAGTSFERFIGNIVIT